MKSLKYWQELMQEKRKKTHFLDFLEEIGSWYPLVFHKYDTQISRHPPSDRIGGVVSSHRFQNNRSALHQTGREYDTTLSFHENYTYLSQSIDFPALIQYENNENTQYGDVILGSKNVYLSTGVLDCENIFYSNMIFRSKNVYHSFVIEDGSENIYMSKCVSNSHNIFYGKYISGGYNLWFCSDCIGCRDCIFCENIKNSQYCIHNIQYSYAEYTKKKSEILGNNTKFYDYYGELKKTGKNINCTHVRGNFNISCENLENGFLCRSFKNGKNAITAGGLGTFENGFDVLRVGEGVCSDMYAVMGAGLNSSHIYSSSEITHSQNIYYSNALDGCNHMLGCIGMSNSSYCILNKQYNKEDWEILADKIFGEMYDTGTLGDMIHPSVNPFYFNDTFAGIVGNFSKSEMTQKGYLWRDTPITTGVPEGAKVVDVKDIEEYAQENNICDVIIRSEEGDYYKILAMEYDFLKKYNLPLPKEHWKNSMRMQMKV